jgi:hypothetical protein
MNSDSKPSHEPSHIELVSRVATWQELASDMIAAIDLLESMNRSNDRVMSARSILMSIDESFDGIRLVWSSAQGRPIEHPAWCVLLRLPALPATTDRLRDDGAVPPNASIDRAISKTAADMLSWTKDPETFEVLEHQRYQLFMRWADEGGAEVNEYAYGLWDE